MSISSSEKAKIIAEYPKLWKEYVNIYTSLIFLSKIADSDCCQTLELDADQRSGLSATLKIIAGHLADNLYGKLPLPHEFEELCKGGHNND